jgi:prepilin-type N-terminal cleavage/methylation domain-containing protein
MYRKQQGFTLVEIAIVLVIIGLLLGGVLKGQELINSAKIKNLVNDMNGASAAIYAYQDRYKSIPGDDPNAATRWASATTVTFPTAATSLGDTKLNGAFDSNTAADESVAFWEELRLAGLISGATAQTVKQPLNAVGGIMGVQWGVGIQTIGATGEGLPGLVVCQTNLLGRIAEAIDNQLDDGKPNAGAVKSWVQGGTAGTQVLVGASGTPSIAATAVTATSYIDDGSTMYTTCKKAV